MYRICGSCDKSSLEFLRMCTKHDNTTDLIQRKRDKFVDQLIDDGCFTNLLFIIVIVFFVSCDFMCSVLCVCLYVHQTN